MTPEKNIAPNVSKEELETDADRWASHFALAVFHNHCINHDHETQCAAQCACKLLAVIADEVSRESTYLESVVTTDVDSSLAGLLLALAEDFQAAKTRRRRHRVLLM